MQRNSFKSHSDLESSILRRSTANANCSSDFRRNNRHGAPYRQRTLVGYQKRYISKFPLRLRRFVVMNMHVMESPEEDRSTSKC